MTIYPDALVILSDRDSDSWWQSARSTILPRIRKSEGEWRSMIDELFENRFTLDTASDSAARLILLCLIVKLWLAPVSLSRR